GKVSAAWQTLFDKLLNMYQPLLRTALRLPVVSISAAIIILVVTVRLVSPLLDVQMLPSTNEGEFRMDITLQEGTRLQITDAQVQKIESYLMSQPEFEQPMPLSDSRQHSATQKPIWRISPSR
ncbi:MAG: efflux RND transporter permease subunit, partial [Calditrichaeota bacterium]